MSCKAPRKVWYRIGDKLACVPPKCGSTSFRLAAAPELGNRKKGESISKLFKLRARRLGIGPYTPEEAGHMGIPPYLAVRHPLERFSSLWRDLQRGNLVKLAGMEFITPDALMDRIESDPEGDSHWAMQTSFACRNAIPVDYRRFLAVLGLPSRWEHRSRRMVVKIPEDRVLAHYAGDLELYLSA